MKKGFLRIVCFMLMVLMLLPPMVIAQGEQPKIEISEPQGLVGDTVQVVFSAKNMPACSSMELVICYDAISLKPLSYQQMEVGGLFFGNLKSTHEGRAAIKLTAASMGMTGKSPIFSGDAELFSIDFEIIGGTLEEQGALVEMVKCDVREDNAQTTLLDVATAPAYVGVPAAQAESIAVTTLPTKTTYLEGKGPLDVEGGMLTVTYDNGVSQEFPLADATLSALDAEQIGEQEITVSYLGLQTAFSVYVAEKEAERIELTTPPHKLSYLEGKDFLDVEGGAITVYYNNDTWQPIPLAPSMVSGFDNTVVGPQTLTVTYGELTTEYQVEIIGKSVQSIAVTTPPTKTTYLEGKDLLDVAGGMLTVYYNNDTFEPIPLERADITGFDNERIGKQNLTAFYEGFAADFEVEIIPLMRLMLEKPYGAALPGQIVPVEVVVQNYHPLSGLSIAVTYDPAYLRLEERGIVAANLPGLTVMTSLQTEGDLAVAKIVWMGAEEAPMEDIFTALTLNFTAIQENPQEDTELEVSFLEGGMVDNNGEFNGYLDMPSVTTIGLAKVASIAMKNLPDLLDYPQNSGVFNTAGGVIELTYDNEGKAEIPLAAATLSGFDNTTPGKKTITVSYCGKTTVFEVDIMGDPQFSDVRPNDWFYSMVQFAKHKGLMKGDPEGTFRPDDSMTRAELVTMFYRLEGEPSHSGRNPFHDVHASDWYYDEILWAAENGIVNGKGEGLFAPADRITRQELVTLFHRYAQKKGLDGGNRIDLSIFADRATIDSWAADPVQWAVAEGLVVGIEEGAGMVFAPKNTATRAQVATIMMRYIQKYKVNV